MSFLLLVQCLHFKSLAIIDLIIKDKIVMLCESIDWFLFGGNLVVNPRFNPCSCFDPRTHSPSCFKDKSCSLSYLEKVEGFLTLSTSTGWHKNLLVFTLI